MEPEVEVMSSALVLALRRQEYVAVALSWWARPTLPPWRKIQEWQLLALSYLQVLNVASM